MSFPSVAKTLPAADAATEEQRVKALLVAFQQDLPLGYAYLNDMAAEVHSTGQRTLRVEDPKSPLGQQLIRLIGADVPRRLLGQHLSVQFGLYNCCSPVAALVGDDLAMSTAEQIKLQNGEIVHADC